MNVLKPCPFCGGEVKLSGMYSIGKEIFWDVYCGQKPNNYGCGARVTSTFGEEEAIRNWNRRVSSERS